MKKFLLLIAAVSISLGAMAQKGKVTSASIISIREFLIKQKRILIRLLQMRPRKTGSTLILQKGKFARHLLNLKILKFKAFYADPLAEAYTAYEKAIELDPKGGIKRKLLQVQVYNSLAVIFIIREVQDLKQKIMQEPFNHLRHRLR
jgi:hypothetical protein